MQSCLKPMIPSKRPFSVIEQELSVASEQIDGVQKFTKAVQRYTDIQGLAYENFREFVEKILCV